MNQHNGFATQPANSRASPYPFTVTAASPPTSPGQVVYGVPSPAFAAQPYTQQAQQYYPQPGYFSAGPAMQQYAQSAPQQWVLAPQGHGVPPQMMVIPGGVLSPHASLPSSGLVSPTTYGAPSMFPAPQGGVPNGTGRPADGQAKRSTVYGQQRSPAQQQAIQSGGGDGQQGDGPTTFANLFVNRLPDGITHTDLLQVFSEFSPKSATVMTDHKTGKSKGFGFIQFNSDADGKAAHQTLHHKPVEVRGVSFVLRAFPSKHDANQSVEISPVLYVRNVPKVVPKFEVERMLESLGSVVFCAMREEPDGLPVWVILVEYDCQMCADNALSHLRINTTLYPEHRAVIAKYAKPMDRKRHDPKPNAVPCPFKKASASGPVIPFGESTTESPGQGASTSAVHYASTATESGSSPPLLGMNSAVEAQARPADETDVGSNRTKGWQEGNSSPSSAPSKDGAFTVSTALPADNSSPAIVPARTPPLGLSANGTTGPIGTTTTVTVQAFELSGHGRPHSPSGELALPGFTQEANENPLGDTKATRLQRTRADSGASSASDVSSRAATAGFENSGYSVQSHPLIAPQSTHTHAVPQHQQLVPQHPIQPQQAMQGYYVMIDAHGNPAGYAPVSQHQQVVFSPMVTSADLHNPMGAPTSATASEGGASRVNSFSFPTPGAYSASPQQTNGMPTSPHTNNLQLVSPPTIAHHVVPASMHMAGQHGVMQQQQPMLMGYNSTSPLQNTAMSPMQQGYLPYFPQGAGVHPQMVYTGNAVLPPQQQQGVRSFDSGLQQQYY